jgi:hypothetical protein
VFATARSINLRCKSRLLFLNWWSVDRCLSRFIDTVSQILIASYYTCIYINNIIIFVLYEEDENGLGFLSLLVMSGRVTVTIADGSNNAPGFRQINLCLVTLTEEPLIAQSV